MTQPAIRRVKPPVDGSLVFPGVIDFNLQNNPTASFFVWANDAVDGDPHVISQLEFARAAHRVAHIVRPKRQGADQDVVAVIANTDTILYQTILAGIIRAGLVPFPVSPRNSAAAVISMLRATGCHRVLVTGHAVGDLLAAISSEFAKKIGSDSYEISFEEIPALSTVYPNLGHEASGDAFDPYPVSTEPPALDDICLYLHSSGSTKHPRAIAQTHRIILQWQQFPGATEVWAHDRPLRFAAYILPPFHLAGMTAQLLRPLFVVNGVSVFPPTSYDNPKAAPLIPSNPNFLAHAKRSKANAIIVVPSFLELWMEDANSMQWLASLEVVIFVGAPLSRKKGDALVAAGTTLSTAYGATEIGGPVHVFPREKDLRDGDWDWIRFSERATPRWISQGDGLFELQLLSTETHQVAIENLPDVKGYATSDLFEKHPTKPDLFRILGRLDDVIVLSAGEKTVPGAMEDLICLSPEVRSAVMFGTGRPQVGLLVDPKPGRVIDPADKGAVEGFKDEIWPFIEKANQDAPAFSRIFKEMLLITQSSKPLPLTAKGTVVRRQALDLYAREVDEVYDALDPNFTTALSENIAPPKGWHGDDLLEWLGEQAAQVQAGKQFDPQADLFSQGFDSLGALFLRNRILGAMRSSVLENVRTSASQVTQQTVFEFPSLAQLSSALSGMIQAPSLPRDNITRDKTADLERQISHYAAGMTIKGDAAESFVPEDAVILLTGSTGSLGSFLLAELLASPHVRQVYALNRLLDIAPSHSRQKVAFKERGLDVTILDSSKLRFLEGDVSQENLGLSVIAYEELHTSVTAIIHNAWRLDFNLPLSSFGPNLQATRALIDFANVASHSPRIIFTSSVSSGQSWSHSRGSYPEELAMDPSVAIGTGYGESKYVAERVLALSKLQTSSLRIGQVSGSSLNGAWSTTDWVPIIVKSSIYLGCLPDLEQTIQWIPADVVSSIILDVLFLRDPPPPTLNIVHPKPISWSFMISAVSDALEKQKISQKLPLVPWTVWIYKVEELGRDHLDEELLQNLPAIKILRFLQRVNRSALSVGSVANADGGADSSVSTVQPFATDNARRASVTFREMGALTVADIERWVQYWHSKGFY